MAQTFTARNEANGKSRRIVHTEEGFEEFGEWLGELRQKTDKEPVVVIEATGHYHRGLVAYMERSGFCHMVTNPLQSKRAKGSQLRKVKTDTVVVGERFFTRSFPLKAPVLPAIAILYRTLKKANQIFLYKLN